MSAVTETSEPTPAPDETAENVETDETTRESDDDRRAAAAAVNRKRAEKEWEENKKRWRAMGVPKGLPAKK